MSAVCIGFNIFISVLVILVHQVKLNENQLAYIFCIFYFNSVNVYFILFIDFFIDWLIDIYYINQLNGIKCKSNHMQFA